MKVLWHYIKWLLLPLGIGHLLVVWLRNKFYDKNIITKQQLPRPVISVGNVQMGGTGKTPLVLALIELLQANGKTVAVLTRGYKRKSQEDIIATSEQLEFSQKQIGDEPAIILSNLQNGVLGVGANRYDVGKKILAAHPVDIFILDDGFQYRKLHRELDICLIDVSRWPGHPFLFPLSYLRDYKTSLHRADLIILSKYEQSGKKAEALKLHLEKKYRVPVLRGRFSFHSLTQFGTQELFDLTELTSQKVAAFCGIANPQNFFDQLEALGLEIVYRKRFTDHYDFQTKDLRTIANNARRAGADWIIITEKDAIKLKEMPAQEASLLENVLVLKIKFELEAETDLKKLLLARKFI